MSKEYDQVQELIHNNDVQELVRQNKPIYVYNRTGRYLPETGPHVLEIKEGGKRAAQVIIPATKYPFLVSGHVPAKLLAEATEFYAALSKGILELVHPDDAKQIMQDPIAKKVQEQALRKFQPVKRGQHTPPELGIKDQSGYRPDGADKGISGLPEATNMPLVVAGTKGEDPEQESDVSPKVLQIVMDLQSDPDLYEEKYLELAGMENLTDFDYGYLLSNCQQFPQILQLAKTELARLVGDDAVAEIEAEQEVEAAAKTAKTKPPARKTRRRRKK